MIVPLLLTCLGIVWLGLRAKKSMSLPPGPLGLPLVGNLFQVPKDKLFLKIYEWKKQFGDIFTFTIAGQRFVVLSGANVAADVLDRLSARTSGRPHYIMPHDIMSGDLLFLFMGYKDKWRRARRISNESFNIRAVETYLPLHENEAKLLVRSLVENPSKRLRIHLMRLSTSSTWRALYGGPSITAEGERKAEKMHGIVDAISTAMLPKSYLVNVLPSLRYLPPLLAPWKKAGAEWYKETNRFFLQLFYEGSDLKEDAGFVSSCAQAKDRFDVDDQFIAWTAGSLFGAGVETTAYSLHFFILAMVRNPEVARKAQEQIDRVVGNRPPTFEDLPKLPYVEALVKETLRWRPVLPIGLFHATTEDVEYNGYVIPKDTFVVGNVWGIHHDPVVTPDHETFRPERFLDPSGRVRKPSLDSHDDMLVFGFGRRICPGRHFAANSMYITAAYLLWAFDFLKAIDEKGQEITPDANDLVDEGVILIYPADFPCVIKPRHKDVIELMTAAE